MRRSSVALLFALTSVLAPFAERDLHAQQRSRDAAYFPGPDGRWERRSASQVGMDSARVAAAVAFAVASESRAPRDLLLAHVQSFGREPFGDAVGPFKERGDPTGLIIRRGYIVAEWGDPARVDMTFSVTKSFLSSVVGVAFDRGLIPDLAKSVHLDMAPVVTLSHAPRSPPT